VENAFSTPVIRCHVLRVFHSCDCDRAAFRPTPALANQSLYQTTLNIGYTTVTRPINRSLGTYSSLPLMIIDHFVAYLQGVKKHVDSVVLMSVKRRIS